MFYKTSASLPFLKGAPALRGAGRARGSQPPGSAEATRKHEPQQRFLGPRHRKLLQRQAPEGARPQPGAALLWADSPPQFVQDTNTVRKNPEMDENCLSVGVRIILP